jgi:hypothetical protein
MVVRQHGTPLSTSRTCQPEKTEIPKPNPNPGSSCCTPAAYLSKWRLRADNYLQNIWDRWPVQKRSCQPGRWSDSTSRVVAPRVEFELLLARRGWRAKRAATPGSVLLRGKLARAYTNGPLGSGVLTTPPLARTSGAPRVVTRCHSWAVSL